MRAHRSAVFRCTLDGAAEALRVAVAGAQGGDGRAVDGNGLRVVAAVVVEFVCVILLGSSD